MQIQMVTFSAAKDGDAPGEWQDGACGGVAADGSWARFLVLDGASQGRKFKAWARHSMAVSRFWYSAYRDFTVDQIERNARIACGLRKETMSEQEAAVWARDL